MPQPICAIVTSEEKGIGATGTHSITIHLVRGQLITYKYSEHSTMVNPVQNLAMVVSKNENINL